MTDQEVEILKLLDNQEELTPEMLALIEEYQQVKKAEEESLLPIGSQCAITFAFGDDLVLLPSIVLGYSDSNTVIQVLILTPITNETVPCHDYFSPSSTCQNTTCPQSHGYSLPTEYVTSFESLGTTDTDSLIQQLQYGKRVWCKDKDTGVWKLGNIIDQLHGPRWRIRLRDNTKKRFNVDIEHIMPFKSVLDEGNNDDEQEEWSESDRESIDDDNTILVSEGMIMDRSKENTFGGWQSHTTGFAAKMMKKMGYIEVKMCAIK